MGMHSQKELFVSQRGKSARLSVLHAVAGSLAVLAGFTRRAPGWCQDHGLRRTGGPPAEHVQPGRGPARTNLTFASLVAREWLRRRLPAQAARPGGTARAGTAGVLPVPSGPARWPGGAGWTGAAERAAESEEAAEPGWAADPEWAAEPAEVGDREQPAAWGKRA